MKKDRRISSVLNNKKRTTRRVGKILLDKNIHVVRTAHHASSKELNQNLPSISSKELIDAILGADEKKKRRKK